MAKCAWCEDEFEDDELTWTKLGHLCDTCIRAIESRGESVNAEEPEYASDVRKLMKNGKNSETLLRTVM